MVALHWGQRIHSPSGTPRFFAMVRSPCSMVPSCCRLRLSDMREAALLLSQPHCQKASRGIALLDLLQCGKGSALDVLQEGTAAGRYMRHLAGEAEFFNRLRR